MPGILEKRGLERALTYILTIIFYCLTHFYVVSVARPPSEYLASHFLKGPLTPTTRSDFRYSGRRSGQRRSLPRPKRRLLRLIHPPRFHNFYGDAEPWQLEGPASLLNYPFRGEPLAMRCEKKSP